MWKTLQSLFNSGDAATDQAPSIEIAALALLLEIARADHNNSDAEQVAVLAAAQRVFAFDAAAAAALVGDAESAVDGAVSMFDFTQVLNQHFDYRSKCQLLEQLWRVAYADGHLDHYEEYYLRKIADLLHLGHADFIRAKLKVGSS